jgi:hypothetical protein
MCWRQQGGSSLCRHDQFNALVRSGKWKERVLASLPPLHPVPKYTELIRRLLHDYNKRTCDSEYAALRLGGKDRMEGELAVVIVPIAI